MENPKEHKTQGKASLQSQSKQSGIPYERRLQRRLNCCEDVTSTPFRCTLSHRLAITRGKPIIEQSILKRRKFPEKEIVKEQKTLKRETAEPNSVFLKLPKISHGARPFVTVNTSGKDMNSKHGGIYDFFNPRNARENWEHKIRSIQRERSDLMESQRSYEDIMKLREKHLISSNLLKTSNVRTTTLPQLVRKSDLTYFEYKNAEEDETEAESSDELESVEDFEDFCKTFKDGSKLIGSNRKLSLEVFMPKIL
ncbi:hypothetical protein AC249_AIPGENE21454 [Exaiptasia diaphana]|nr:hypothetical protein AC249_AIPGENE21454 [Exaiptasia diaphana]